MSTIRRGACNLCEAICGLRIEVADGEVTDIRGDEGDPLSRGHLCPKAYGLRDLQHDPDRLRYPMRRERDRWRRIDWDEALELAAARLATVRRDHGRDAVAAYLGNPVVHSLGAMTHGTTFLRMLETRNRYSAGSVDQWPHQLVAARMYGNQWLLPVPDVDRASHLLVVGANPVVSNGSLMTAPGLERRLRRLRARGGRLVVVDPRRTETAAIADEHHPIRPGTDAAMLLAMVRTLLDEGLARPASYVEGIEAVARAVEPYTPERAADVTGVPASTIRRLARELAAADGAACYGRTGVSTQRHGTLCQWAIQLLNILTGNLDRPGGTLLPRPAVDPLRTGMVDAGHQGRWHSRVRGLPEYGGELPVAVLAEEIRTPGQGRVRALITVAGNPVLSTPGGGQLAHALDGLDFMVAVDFYVNETTRHADLILPPTTPLEREHYDLIFHGLAVRNTARYVDPVLPRPDGARHEWEIFAELGRRYRRHVRGGSAADRLLLRIPPRRLVDLGLRSGPYRVSLAKVRRAPAGLDLGPLRPSLPRRLRTRPRRVRVAPPQLIAAAKRARSELLERQASDELLLIGRRHLRDNNSWMHNLPSLVRGRPRHHLLMHVDDLADRGIEDGAHVRVTSRSGTITVEVRATTDVMPGVASLPHGYGHGHPVAEMSVASSVPGASANDLTDPAVVDEASGTGVLNGVPVTVEPAPPSG